MGDGMTNTVWDLTMYFLVFGGVPALAVLVPLVAVPFFYRACRRFRN